MEESISLADKLSRDFIWLLNQYHPDINEIGGIRPYSKLDGWLVGRSGKPLPLPSPQGSMDSATPSYCDDLSRSFLNFSMFF